VHDLRHTAGTPATAAGGSLREVMDRLGHSTNVAAVRYQHVMADRDAAIAVSWCPRHTKTPRAAQACQRSAS
jgi:integrase